jgi:hypothetical protein
MANVYYWDYDVLVDSETGEFLETICKCLPEDNCEFKDNWIRDGQPTKLSIEQLNELRK